MACWITEWCPACEVKRRACGPTFLSHSGEERAQFALHEGFGVELKRSIVVAVQILASKGEVRANRARDSVNRKTPKFRDFLRSWQRYRPRGS